MRFSCRSAGKVIRFNFVRNASTTAKPEIFLDSDSTGNFFKIALPVQKQGKVEKTAFVVNGNDNVSHLVNSIQREHQSESAAGQECYFVDNEGVRISGATSIATLVMTNFRLRLNQKTLEVESRITGQDGSFLTPSQLQTISDYLSSLKVESLPLATFFEFTKKAGISNSCGTEALKFLSRAGRILYLWKDAAMRETIFLNPDALAATIEQSLVNNQLFRLPLREKILALDNLRKQKSQLDAIREISFRKADRNAHVIATTGFVFICCQFILYARLTWWDSDWDVMEPITWFTGVVEMVIGGMAYYLFKGSEFAHMGFREGLLAWQLKRQYAKRGFNEETYQKILWEIAELETQITLIQSQPFSSNKE